MNAQRNSITEQAGTLTARSSKYRSVGFLLSALPAFGILALVSSLNATSLAADVNMAVVKTPYTVTTGPYTLVDLPQRAWVDEEGILHIRGLAAIGQVAGDYGGTILIVQDENVDTITGDGDYHGYFIWETVIDGRSGIFEGRYSGNIHGFSGAVLSGLYTDEEWVAQGIYGLKGMKIMGKTLPGTGVGPYTHLGILLSHPE